MNIQEIRSKTELEIPRATGSLREVQLRMLDILLEVKRLCNKHDIRYWLDFGTLLGAVRHAGFIPWDDDLDVCVLEDDFERFLRVCSEELPDWLVLQTEKTEKDSGMGAGLVKIRDKNSLYIHDFDSFRSDYSKGIFIDVFIPFLEVSILLPRKKLKIDSPINFRILNFLANKKKGETYGKIY